MKPGHQQIIHARLELNRANTEADKEVPDLAYILISLDNAIRDLRDARQKLRRRQKLAEALKK